MKTLTAAMTSHINQDVTTLTTLFKVTRTDGVVIRVTAHDTDIEFGGETYSALSGVNRTAIQASGDMKVDNLDVVGVLGLGTDVTDEDLRNGKLDFATVEIFSVNWTDPDRFGSILHRKGVLGEIKLTDNGYTAELRGLTQILARRRGSVYQPRCRVNLFSPLKDPVTGQNGCGLLASDFEETTLVETVVSNRQFVLPSLITRKFAPSADVEQKGVIVSADGVVTLLPDIEDGTTNRPIGVSTPTELNNIRDDPYGYYVLENDIDMSGFGNWTPIPVFHGVLDGRGYKITQLSAAGSTDNTGLVAILTGEIRRLGMVECDMDAGSSVVYTGQLAGIVRGAGAVGEEGAGLVEECYAVGGFSDGNGDQVGGLVGQLTNGAVARRCWAAVEIQGAIGPNAGAFIGNTAAGSTIEDCYWNSDMAGTSDPGNHAGTVTNLVEVTDADFQDQATYGNLDFNDLWKIQDVPTTNIGGGAGVSFFDLNPDAISRNDGGNFFDEGILPGGLVTITGASLAANNGTFRVRELFSATVMVLDAAESLSADTVDTGVSYSYDGPPGIMDPGRF